MALLQGAANANASNQALAYELCVTGSKYVFHVASPALLTAEDHQRDIVDPAVEVTAHESCAYFMSALSCAAWLPMLHRQGPAVHTTLSVIVVAHRWVQTQLPACFMCTQILLSCLLGLSIWSWPGRAPGM